MKLKTASRGANPARHPLLWELIQSGLVKLDRDWIGLAADGTWVSFGATADGAERYLTANPTPGQW